MSWYISTLLKDSRRIRQTSDIESDEFNDLIIVEKQIEVLHKKGAISEKEMKIIDAMKTNRSSYDLSRELKINRGVIYKIFNSITERLAYYLGDEFTDIGYISYMTTKYNLTEKEITKLVKYMHGKYKYSISK